MNGRTTIPQIGIAQTYFAAKTRMQELFEQLPAAQKRLQLRERVKGNNKILAGAAKRAGVQNFPRFQDAGYRGLYGGNSLATIKAMKGIPKKDDLLDRAGRAELAANDFRITQTEERLAGDLVCDENEATRIHKMVGETVRQTIRDLGGTPPENLPAEPHIKELLKEQKAIMKLAAKAEDS